jgi:hypothetical protein
MAITTEASLEIILAFKLKNKTENVGYLKLLQKSERNMRPWAMKPLKVFVQDEK